MAAGRMAELPENGDDLDPPLPQSHPICRLDEVHGYKPYDKRDFRSGVESGSMDAVGNDDRSISITREIVTSPSLMDSMRARVAAKEGLCAA